MAWRGPGAEGRPQHQSTFLGEAHAAAKARAGAGGYKPQGGSPVDSEGPVRVQGDGKGPGEGSGRRGTGGVGGASRGPLGAQMIPRASCALVIRSTL